MHGLAARSAIRGMATSPSTPLFLSSPSHYIIRAPNPESCEMSGRQSDSIRIAPLRSWKKSRQGKQNKTASPFPKLKVWIRHWVLQFLVLLAYL